jgi:hypothetical protein
MGRLLDDFPRWSLLFTLLYEVLAFSRRAASLPVAVRAVEAKRLLRARATDLHLVGLPGLPLPRSDVFGAALWQEFGRWSLTGAATLAAGDEGKAVAAI